MEHSVLLTKLKLLSGWLEDNTIYEVKFTSQWMIKPLNKNTVIYFEDFIERFTKLSKNKSYILSPNEVVTLKFNLNVMIELLERLYDLNINTFDYLFITPTKSGFKYEIFDNHSRVRVSYPELELVTTSNYFIKSLTRLLHG